MLFRSNLEFVGKGRLDSVDLHRLGEFRAAVPGTPDANYAWAIYGQLRIGSSGRYTLCITSDDGCACLLSFTLQLLLLFGA